MAISDSVLITLTANWRKINLQNNGELISLQPGVIGDVANRSLKPFVRKIGPDPASIKAAIITVILLIVNLPCGLRQLAKFQYNEDTLFLLVNG